MCRAEWRRPAMTTILLTNSLQISKKYVDRASRRRLSYNPKNQVGERDRCSCGAPSI